MPQGSGSQQPLEAAQAQIRQLSQQLAAERATARQTQAHLQEQLAQQQQHLTQLAAQNQQLQAIVAASPAITYRCEARVNYGCTFVTPNVLAVLGYTPEEVYAEPQFWQQRLHPDDAERAQAEIARLFEQGSLTSEYRLRHRDGHYVWLRDKRTVLGDDQGESAAVVGYFTDISDRQQLEVDRQQSASALHEQQRFIEQIIQTSPGIIYLFDLPSRTNPYISRASVQDLGYPPDEIRALGADLFVTLMHPEDLPRLAHHIHCLNQSQDGEVVEFEYRLRHRNGDWHWFYSRDLVYLRDEQGQVQQLLGSTLDITDRKQTEQRIEQERQRIAAENRQYRRTLKEQEATYRQLFDCNPQPMWVYDRETLRFLAVNEAAIAKYGYSEAEFLAMTITQIRPPEDVPRLLENVAQVDSGLDMAGIWSHCLRSGQLIQVEVVSYALTFEGRPAELVMAQDVTQRLEAEHALQVLNSSLEQAVADRTAALHRSQSELRAILNSSPARIYVEDLDGRYLFANQKFLDLIHGQLDDVLGKTPHELFSAEIAETFRANEQVLLAQGGVQQFEETVRVDGEERVLLSHKFLLRNDQGEVYALCGMSTDITDRKAIEVDLQQSRDRLQAMMAALPDHVFRVNREGRYLDFYPSDYAPELTGLDTLVGRTMTEVLPAALAQTHQHHIHQALSTRTVQVYEQTVTVQGEQRVREVRVAPCGSGEVLFVIRDVTTRKRNETQIHRQLAAIEAAVDGIAILQDNAFLYVNRAHLELFGYTRPEALLGQSWWMLYAPEERARLTREVLPVLERDGAWSGEAIATRQDGTTFDQGVSLTMTEDGLAICVCEDISDRKSAERALKTSRAFLQVVLETAPVAIFWKDLQGTYRGANPQTAALFGLSSTVDLIDHTDAQLAWSPPVVNTIQAEDRQIIATQTPHLNIVQHLITTTGVEVWLEINKVPLRDEAGQVCGILGTAQNVTQRQRAELALQELNNRLTLALQAGQLGVWSWDLDQQLFWDAALCRIYGLPETQQFPSWEAWRNQLHQADLERVEALLQAAIEGEPYTGVEFRIWRTDGELRWIQSFAQVQRDEQGRPVRMVGLNRDISDRKQIELNLQRSNQELARATRLKDEFLANMSHELRTPLNAVLGMAEGLQEGVFGPITEAQQRSLETIERSGTHLLSLINDILDLSKVEAGQLELDWAPVSVSVLCDSSLTFVKHQAHKKRLQITTQISTRLPDLYGDERRLRQVLINLLTNAVKFTPEGGRITVAAAYTALSPAAQDSQPDLLHPQGEASDTQGVLTLSIADTGIGISPENLPRLFQPFVQVDGALNRQHEGTGLGLALVKRLTELHGGTVELTSELGHGSCFTLRLPVIAIATDAAQATGYADTPDTTPLTAADRPPLILLADDNEANVSTTTAYLQAKGYDLIVAANGREAIDRAQDARPDLILIDIQMPQLDGLEAIRQIRQLPELENVPIVALTALAMAADQERCLAAGADEYISKPLRLKQLAQLIATLLASPSPA